MGSGATNTTKVVKIIFKIYNMKTQHYTNVRPVKPEPTNSDILKAITIIVSLFTVGVLILAGVDLIDQITLWLK